MGIAMVKTTLTKRELADEIAEKLATLHHKGLDLAVGLDKHGRVATCFEGGLRLEAVLVQQSMDTASYGGGSMAEDDVCAVADCFYDEWLDEHNRRPSDGTTDEQIEWADDDQRIVDGRMEMNAEQAIADAIDNSVARNEIVRIGWSRELEEELYRECEDSVRNGDVLESWGEREDGATWRIHLEGA